MGRPNKANDVLKAFHGLDDWLKTDESLFWLQGYMAMSMKQFQERGSLLRQWNTVYGDTTDPATFRSYLAADLWKARLFQVTEEMVDLTSGSWQHSKLDMSGLEENHLPSPYGWAWLDKQFIRRGDDNEEMGTSAVSWGLVPALPGVRMAFYHRTSDVNRMWTTSMRDDYLASHGRHNLQYTHSNVVPFEVKIGIPSFGGDNIINWMKVLWALMDAEISTEEHQRGFTPYNMKRHRERFEGKKPEVTVILLRRATPRLPKEDGPAVPRMIDWSLGRVVVQGFHRHISANYAPIPHHHALPNKDDANKSCKTCGNEITWVRGYLRGPEGLPIRNAEQLWRLSR